MRYPKFPFLFLWYIRRELPGWGKLYSLLGMDGIDNVNPRWQNAPTLNARGKFHRYQMALDLSRDLDRSTYFVGRYYDLPIQLLLNTLLKAGDTFIDGGANTGMMTLHAASLVGPSGQVIAFEPIPENCKKIERAVATNDITQIQIVNKALGEDTRTMTLNILGGDTIMSTFRTNQRKPLELHHKIDVPVVRGDDELGSASSGPMFIKLDLEGWEYFALLGFDQTVKTRRPIILLEVEPKYLQDAGLDEHVLHNWMVERGYEPFVVGLNRSTLTSPRLRLMPYQTVEQLAALNDFSNPRLASVRTALGNGSEYVDVVWLPREYDRRALSDYIVALRLGD